MKWTTEYPTQPGYYWLRNYQLDVWKRASSALTKGPDIVEVSHRLDFDFTGDDRGYSKLEVVSAEWFGPIQTNQQQFYESLTQALNDGYRLVFGKGDFGNETNVFMVAEPNQHQAVLIVGTGQTVQEAYEDYWLKSDVEIPK